MRNTRTVQTDILSSKRTTLSTSTSRSQTSYDRHTVKTRYCRKRYRSFQEPDWTNKKWRSFFIQRGIPAPLQCSAIALYTVKQKWCCNFESCESRIFVRHCTRFNGCVLLAALTETIMKRNTSLGRLIERFSQLWAIKMFNKLGGCAFSD